VHYVGSKDTNLEYLDHYKKLNKDLSSEQLSEQRGKGRDGRDPPSTVQLDSRATMTASKGSKELNTI